MKYQEQLDNYARAGKLPKELVSMLYTFCKSYSNAAISNGHQAEIYDPPLALFLEKIVDNIENPYHFEPYHQHQVAPFNYYHFGLEFTRPIVILDRSTILHAENLNLLAAQLKQGDNVILLANHQTELDPQAISLLVERTHPQLAEEMIFVAGHRVISDPLAVPLSRGRNLLCIFSKKYIEDEPLKKEERRIHNQKTMLQMSQLLSEGGKCIYVAPSGGRDRAERSGKVSVAPFDPQSIEMFWLMAQRAEKPTHFYPLALTTYHLLPPPEGINKKLGEPRYTKAIPVHIAFGKEIDMNHFPGSDQKDKVSKRKARAQYIWEMVQKDYQELIKKG
jgi:glycerol-3-phosphate O-acyltransferase